MSKSETYTLGHEIDAAQVIACGKTALSNLEDDQHTAWFKLPPQDFAAELSMSPGLDGPVLLGVTTVAMSWYPEESDIAHTGYGAAVTVYGDEPFSRHFGAVLPTDLATLDMYRWACPDIYTSGDVLSHTEAEEAAIATYARRVDAIAALLHMVEVGHLPQINPFGETEDMELLSSSTDGPE